MSYRALYRVWRSQTFADLIGQEHVTKTLTNALAEGHFSHAYLFSGPRGTGKTSTAKIMAKAINCLNGPSPEPCNECEACRKITTGSLMDVVEIDAASNRGVDEIRDLRDKVKYAPSEVRYKVYIVDEVHMLTTEAFNALLKTLEEPPEHVVFILATTEPHKLPATIISRCQRFSFRRISLAAILQRLRMICEAQNVAAEDAALTVIAQAADGGMRDALSLLDQVMAFADDGKISEEAVLAVTGSASRQSLAAIVAGILEQKPSDCLERVDRLLNEGLEAERLIHDLIHLTRDLMLIRTAPDLQEIEQRLGGDAILEQLATQSSAVRLGRVLERLIYTQQQMKWAAQPRILLEVALVDLTQCPPDSTEAAAGKETDDVQEIARLKEELRQLRQQWEEWKGGRSHLPTSAPTSAPADASPPASVSSPNPKKKVQPSRPRPAPVAKGEVASMLARSTPERLQRLKGLWPEVLGRVKERKITVHAWLIDGEPVAAAEDAVLIAFRNAIHRDTTEREGNKGLIEEVLQEVMGSSQRLITVMKEEFDAIQPVEQAAPPVTSTTSSKGESADSVAGGQGERDDDPVKQAIDFFGKDMIEITD
ncbi:DNA polymerase III subunit gamma/tau [Desmospora activa]|uniref:DNA-directed DNA polymerase n=1 Tax=Desmospora activa DSM 45169 TaxID=1121389 RepID=A0A2T4Z4X3_9BACL|nr:DNA polymerase III subunit gamma/tau [Desmospora activa]PTM56951.1 DNA polymerase III tau subunit [Desmospora activa DSM 45169]